MAGSIISIPEAIEVFVHAFSQVKSRTYPYVPTQIGNLWVMRDQPPRKKERKVEVITHGQSPQEAKQAIDEAEIGWHFLCDMHSPDEDFKARRAQFKELGYRAISTEWLFVHDLQAIPKIDSNPPVRYVPDEETLAQLNLVTSEPRNIRPNTRYFSIWDETQDYGHVRSIPYKDSAWVSDLFVEQEHRGKGYGRALMSSLLQSDKENGVMQSVLLASSDGARLYPHMGYQQIGILQMFCPNKRT